MKKPKDKNEPYSKAETKRRFDTALLGAKLDGANPAAPRKIAAKKDSRKSAKKP